MLEGMPSGQNGQRHLLLTYCSLDAMEQRAADVLATGPMAVNWRDYRQAMLVGPLDQLFQLFQYHLAIVYL